MELIVYIIAVFGLAAFVYFVRNKKAHYIAAILFCCVQLTLNYLIIVDEMFLRIFLNRMRFQLFLSQYCHCRHYGDYK